MYKSGRSGLLSKFCSIIHNSQRVEALHSSFPRCASRDERRGKGCPLGSKLHLVLFLEFYAPLFLLSAIRPPAVRSLENLEQRASILPVIYELSSPSLPYCIPRGARSCCECHSWHSAKNVPLWKLCWKEPALVRHLFRRKATFMQPACLKSMI